MSGLAPKSLIVTITLALLDPATQSTTVAALRAEHAVTLTCIAPSHRTRAHSSAYLAAWSRHWLGAAQAGSTDRLQQPSFPSPRYACSPLPDFATVTTTVAPYPLSHTLMTYLYLNISSPKPSIPSVPPPHSTWCSLQRASPCLLRMAASSERSPCRQPRLLPQARRHHPPLRQRRDFVSYGAEKAPAVSSPSLAPGIPSCHSLSTLMYRPTP